MKKLMGIVGESNIHLEQDDLKLYYIDGLQPEVVISPSNVEEVSEVMKLATKESLSVLPMGSATKSSLGNKPVSADIVLSTKNLNKIVEHAASDLVATTQTGISIREFQDELGKENQFLALDPPHVLNGATVGGVIATNDSGPERLRYGTIREFLIGIKVVQADGSIFKGGSKVVKNVAGYDLPKLFVGSLGTLGILVEATFRLYPVPEYSETYIVNFRSMEDAHRASMSLLGSDIVLTSLELVNPFLTSTIIERNDIKLEQDKYTLAIRIRNVEKAVRDQISTVKDICEQFGGNGDELRDASEHKFWEDIRNFPWELIKSDRVVCKASILVTDIPKLIKNIEELADKSDVKPYILVRAGSGICILAFEGEPLVVQRLITGLRMYVVSLGGQLVVQEAPESIKADIDVWGDIGSGQGIMNRIKSNFDPDNLLNPGRYI